MYELNQHMVRCSVVYTAIFNILHRAKFPPTVLWHSYGSPHTERPRPHGGGSCNDVSVFIVGMEVA